MLEDLRVWFRFLQTFNGRSVFPDPRQLSSHDILLYTDASGSIGYGAVFGTNWFNGKWTKWWTGQNITLLELYPIVVAIENWGHELQNKRFVPKTDNAALVAVLQKQTS